MKLYLTLCALPVGHKINPNELLAVANLRSHNKNVRVIMFWRERAVLSRVGASPGQWYWLLVEGGGEREAREGGRKKILHLRLKKK